MTDLDLRHTGQLDAAALDAARRLMDVAFCDFEDDDWQHALGGLHALLWAEGHLVGHASLVQRRLLHRGRSLRAGYVEAVAVHPDARRRGHGSALMAAVEDVAGRAHDVVALGATDDGAALYAGRGWQRWRGPTSVLTPDGVVRTPDDDGGVWVLPGRAELDLDGELVADWRDGDVW